MDNSNKERLWTEDDTFRILARPSVDKMKELHAAYVFNWKSTHDGHYPTTQNIVFAKLHGWTWIEYQRQISYLRQHI